MDDFLNELPGTGISITVSGFFPYQWEDSETGDKNTVHGVFINDHEFVCSRHMLEQLKQSFKKENSDATENQL